MVGITSSPMDILIDLEDSAQSDVEPQSQEEDSIVFERCREILCPFSGEDVHQAISYIPCFDTHIKSCVEQKKQLGKVNIHFL